MANYNVQITNGVGSQAMKNGNYAVSVTANGYDATTLQPTTYTAAQGGAGAFTLRANGTLTLTFNETGEEGGAPITSGTVVMTDGTGTTHYGQPVAIGANGEAVFNNVPFSAETPYVLYFTQLETDEAHNIHVGVITVNMNAATLTQYVLNSPLAEQSFTLTDETYTGLPVAAATLAFTGE